LCFALLIHKHKHKHNTNTNTDTNAKYKSTVRTMGEAITDKFIFYLTSGLMWKYFAHFIGCPSLCAVLCCAVDMLSIVLVHFWLEAIDFSCLHPLSFVLWRLCFPFAVLPLYYFAIYCTLCRRLILTLSVLLCFSFLRKSFLTLSLSLNPYQL